MAETQIAFTELLGRRVRLGTWEDQKVSTFRKINEALNERNWDSAAQLESYFIDEANVCFTLYRQWIGDLTGYLREESGFPFKVATNLVEATQDTQGFVFYSSRLRSLAVKLIKVCNDLRLLSSGPRAGLAEIQLPERQPGSSIMPGKVNPVIPEVMNQICFKIMGNDLTVAMGAQAGQLQLNVMEPVIAASILESIRMMMNGSATLRSNCIDGITANPAVCEDNIAQSIGVVTALVPVLGYKPSTALAAEALRSGKGVVELVREKGLLTEAEIARVLAPERMAKPGQFS